MAKGQILEDLNNITESGMYTVPTGCANRPSFDNFATGMLQLICFNAGNAVQLIFRAANGACAVRCNSSADTWTDWKELPYK